MQETDRFFNRILSVSIAFVLFQVFFVLFESQIRSSATFLTFSGFFSSLSDFPSRFHIVFDNIEVIRQKLDIPDNHNQKK